MRTNGNETLDQVAEAGPLPPCTHRHARTQEGGRRTGAVGEEGIEHITVEEVEHHEEDRKPHCEITDCPPYVHTCAGASVLTQHLTRRFILS